MENNNNTEKVKSAPKRTGAQNPDKRRAVKRADKAPAAKAVNQRPAKKPVKRVKHKGNAVRIIFLGGVGEIGKNMTAIECGDDIIIIDAGAIFPTDETPRFRLNRARYHLSFWNEKKKVRGVVLTHGHEDHIGGVPYL